MTAMDTSEADFLNRVGKKSPGTGWLSLSESMVPRVAESPVVSSLQAVTWRPL